MSGFENETAELTLTLDVMRILPEMIWNILTRIRQ